jgi:hypothetical protein
MEEFETMTADERNRYLRQLLKEDHTITFTKVDGTERVMPCTLRTSAMPPVALNEHHKTRLYNPEVLSVWCLDKNEWRSFKVMNVKKIEKLST